MKIEINIPDKVIDRLKEKGIDPEKFINWYFSSVFIEHNGLDFWIKVYKGEINLTS